MHGLLLPKIKEPQNTRTHGSKTYPCDDLFLCVPCCPWLENQITIPGPWICQHALHF